MFRTTFRSSQVRCEVQKFMKFTGKIVNKASDWLLQQAKPMKCLVCKPVFESHYELLNFIMNLRTFERSSQHFCVKFAEIDCNTIYATDGLVKKRHSYWKIYRCKMFITMFQSPILLTSLMSSFPP